MNVLDERAIRTAASVNGLRKAYGKKVVLDGVDLSIGEVDVFALLGPNAAGKTTLAGIPPITRGPRGVNQTHTGRSTE